MTNSTLFCVNCKWHKQPESTNILQARLKEGLHECTHDNLEEYNLVTGVLLTIDKTCSRIRDEDTLCGKQGVWWESK
jgi:hypothetical protein